MRTTLKKRTRRSANGNGNGNGAYPPGPLPLLEPPLRAPPPPPPPAPPSASSGRAFYRVRRNPLKLLAKGVMWLVVAALVAAGALAGGVKLYFDYSVAAVRPTSKEVIEAAESLDAVVAGKPAVAIVIGYDKRPGDTSAGRSDTVMLLRADPDKNALTMLSFPRDLVVEHPGCEGHPAWTGRINEAYAYCGPRGTLTTVKQLAGIPINYMITVNFRAFTDIVDKLDGVYMDVDHRYFNDNAGVSTGSTYATIDLEPGYQRLNGNDALDFVRFRHTDSDLYRVVRQQEFVKALKQRVSSAWDIFQLPRIVKTVTENIEVGKGGGQELSSSEVLKYANLAYTLPAGNFQQVPLDGVSGYFELSVPESAIDDAIRRFMNPDVKASEKAIAAATGKKLKDETAPAPSEVGIEILNGSGVAGAADEATVLLGQIGYNTKNGGNAENFDYFRTTVQYAPGIENSKAAAQSVADLFGEADVEEAPARESLTTTLRVIVGKTFQGTLGPAPADDTPESQAPRTSEDASLVPALRSLRKKVDFPVLAPTLREAGSSIDDNEGIRAYKLDDHRALRLTYHTATNEYWGIQETSWEDPPILDEPTLERMIHGRNYKLFFSGARLHVVAFQQDGGVYWVVNTLRNALSNETMLAIARGLKPLGST